MEVYVTAKELLAAAKFAYNKNNYSRPALLGVMVKVDDKGNYTISSTDSYKAVEFNSGFIDAHAIAGECAVPIDTIKDSIKASDSVVRIERADDSDAITMTIYKGKSANRVVRASVECKNVDTGRIFNSLKKMLDENDAGAPVSNDKIAVALNATFLGDCCTVITSAYGKNKPVEIMINGLGSNKPIMFAAKHEDNKYCRGLLMPVKI